MNDFNTLFAQTINQLAQHQHLSVKQSRDLFVHVFNADICNEKISALLTALKMKGEVESEILGVIQAIMSKHIKFPKRNMQQGSKIADCCGTGGDGQSTLNISTAVAILASTQGVKVAKHGNRAISSQCGASDVLLQLGISSQQTTEQASELLEEYDLCFLHAPNYHPIMAKIAPIRENLKFRTIFNLIGPLINPVKPKYQLLGVYDKKYTKICAQVLSTHVERAIVVHGSGTDECAIHDKTVGHMIKNNQITPFSLTPESVGLKRYSLSCIKGSHSRDNAKKLLDLLKGNGEEAYKSVVALNTGVLFFITKTVDNIQDGVKLAQDILHTDAGYQKILQVKGALC